MKGRHPGNQDTLAIGVLLSFLAVFYPAVLSPLAAQQTPPTFDEILQRLESNLVHYDTDIPSFFCDEHVVSQVSPGPRTQDTITEAIFRLKRVLNDDHTISLNESRDIKTVNGQPVKSEDLNGPSILHGAFSGGLAIVSVSQKACMRYSLRPIKPNRPNDSYIVQFESLFDDNHPAECLLREEGSGRVYVDPHTMQITRMEITAPHHTIFAGGKTDNGYILPPVVGVWSISVDYAPVQMGGQTFWMPRTIESSATEKNVGGLIPSVWSFKAHYSNYHKLEVSSRIVPPESSSAP